MKCSVALRNRRKLPYQENRMVGEVIYCGSYFLRYERKHIGGVDSSRFWRGLEDLQLFERAGMCWQQTNDILDYS